MSEETRSRAEVVRTRDVVGQEVQDADGKKAGSVKDLLLERDGRTVRFFAVDLGLFKSQVLVPADELEPRPTGFALRRWTADHLKTLPAYQPDRPLGAAVLEEMARAHPRSYGELRDEPPIPVRDDARIVPFKQARKFRLAEGAPDLRGWEVFGADGERVGTVAEMLVQPAAGAVRYLDVDLMDDLYTLAEDRHVLVPVDAVELKERGQDVWFTHAPASAASLLPAYTGGEVDPALAERVDPVFAQATTAPAALPAEAAPAEEPLALEPGEAEETTSPTEEPLVDGEPEPRQAGDSSNHG